MMNLFQQFQGFMQNPMGFLTQNKISLPPEFQNNPRGAVQYLMNNGKMSQADFNKIYQMAQSFGIKL